MFRVVLFSSALILISTMGSAAHNTVPFQVLSPAINLSQIGHEFIPTGEKEAIDLVLKEIKKVVQKDATSTGHGHRDAHAKAHGCVRASFEVLDSLDQELKVGLFKTPKTYQSWIRYSNGSGKSQKDSDGDGRGMAIKVMGVQDSASTTQDFLMINYPSFFVRNANDYVDFTHSVTNSGNPIGFFLNWHFAEFFIAFSIQGQKVNNLLETRYWSMTPYLFGNDEFKYSARPCHKNKLGVNSASNRNANFLRNNLHTQLDPSGLNQSSCFTFEVQLRKNNPELPIEDPTINWSEKVSPFKKVALITIEPQEFLYPEQIQFCENLSMNPWHHTPEFRPLGGINRARKAIYEGISNLRHIINQNVSQEPSSFDIN